MSIDDNVNLNEQKLIKKGILKEPPGPYQAAVYNNYWCFTDRDEQYLYKSKHRRVNPLLNMTLGYLFQRKGIVQ